jgi:hypothetical protein
MRALFIWTTLAAATAGAEVRPVHPAPFDFSTYEKPVKKTGLLRRLFNHVDGGDFRGFPSLDASVRRPENALHTMTVRWKGQF